MRQSLVSGVEFCVFCRPFAVHRCTYAHHFLVSLEGFLSLLGGVSGTITWMQVLYHGAINNSTSLELVSSLSLSSNSNSHHPSQPPPSDSVPQDPQ